MAGAVAGMFPAYLQILPVLGGVKDFADTGGRCHISRDKPSGELLPGEIAVGERRHAVDVHPYPLVKGLERKGEVSELFRHPGHPGEMEHRLIGCSGREWVVGSELQRVTVDPVSVACNGGGEREKIFLCFLPVCCTCHILGEQDAYHGGRRDDAGSIS